MARVLTVLWIAWLLTLPAVLVFAWWLAEACTASTPDSDCGIVYMLPVGWTLPWVIGVGVMAFGIVVFRRGPRV